MRSDFAALILTHGRPRSQKTMKALRRYGYTGRIVLVVDDEDDMAGEYRELYGEDVVTFCKRDYVASSQTMCPSSDIKRGVILYARNAAFDIAKDMGLTYFVELDDDYTEFTRRIPSEDGRLLVDPIKRLDVVFDAMCGFLDRTGACTIAMAQGGDFIGGAENNLVTEGRHWKRKAMNSFVLRADSDFRFLGAVNEDCVTYALLGGIGKVFLTTLDASLTQTVTQKAKGGMSGEYKEDGTYCKSMFAVVARPDCCSISTIGTNNIRIHHSIQWRYAVPKIVRRMC